MPISLSPGGADTAMQDSLHSETALDSIVRLGCRRALNEQDRDPYSPTFGCFDRRYWSWKLVDFPEATFQRLVYPLTWLLRRAERAGEANAAEAISASIIAGLMFGTRIQHRDGSFDQAFPHEHSYGATAFLVHPLLVAYAAVRDRCTSEQRDRIEAMAFRGAQFLTGHREVHGRITNHLAGGVLSLLTAAEALRHPTFAERGQALLGSILSTQSPEGWFPEYGGADPGYQTLCVYYLASVAALAPDAALSASLRHAVEFLAWFAHPDGSFGGEYGSRRTAVYYPGGVALLSSEIPVAATLTRSMTCSILEGKTTTVADVDIANLAPLLSNYVIATDARLQPKGEMETALPWATAETSHDFRDAQLYVRAKGRFYVVVGAATGGVVKVFDRQTGRLRLEDAGYVGALGGIGLVTSQASGSQQYVKSSPTSVELTTRFVRLGSSVPTPARFVLLRLLNLTLMRSITVGNWVKHLLVKMLIRPGSEVPVTLTRRVEIGDDEIRVCDWVQTGADARFRWLEGGRPFVSIHMASARYLDGEAALQRPRTVRAADVARLASDGTWSAVTVVR
jgi:hypothetical protein